ncbi:MAG: two-component system, NarL family, sensor histidine kinase NreB [Actinomycetota bacterium]|jgi:PAS domain S-box-containing protein|nr:two-component system, NarL family, sensor histidine kinase NreB [Actinomycetota bacterium]
MVICPEPQWQTPNRGSPVAEAGPTREPFFVPEIDLSDGALPTGKILEVAFREAVTELALLTAGRRFLRANAAMCRLLGRSEAELTGLAVEDLAHPDDRHAVLAALEDARSGVLRGFRIWARAIGADGSTIPMLVAATMLRDETGAELCFFVQVLGAETTTSSAPWRPGTEQRPVIDFTCDREGRLVGVSPVAQLFGWNPEELQNVQSLDLVHPADRARAEAALHEVILQPGVPVQLPTLRFRDREGAWWPVDAVAINLLEHHPGVIRVSARIGNANEEGRSEVRILDAEPDERAYFARELHDGLGQILTSLSLFARSIEGELQGGQRRRLAALRVLADEALATTRSLAWSLRAQAAPLEGMTESLRSLAATIGSRTGLSIQLSGEVKTRFGLRVEAAVYRIVEEALTNVMRHASATTVTISLQHSGERLTVVVQDDGAGFDPSLRTLTAGSGMGLLCMEERARLVDGFVEIDSAPGRGAALRLSLPVPPPGSPPIGPEGVAARPPESR